MKYKIYHIHHHFFIIVFWTCIQLQIFQRVKLEEKKNGNYLVINQAGPEDKGVSSYNLIPYLKTCLIFRNTANPLMKCQFFFSFKIKKGLEFNINIHINPKQLSTVESYMAAPSVIGFLALPSNAMLIPGFLHCPLQIRFLKYLIVRCVEVSSFYIW